MTSSEIDFGSYQAVPDPTCGRYLRKVHKDSTKRGDLCPAWGEFFDFYAGLGSHMGYRPTPGHILVVLANADADELAEHGADYMVRLRPWNVAWQSPDGWLFCGIARSGSRSVCRAQFTTAQELVEHRVREHFHG